jgi:tRNA nucleotidyltransferase (CCA-adding enzyme)
MDIYGCAQKIGMEMGIWENAPEPYLTGQMLLDMGLKPGPHIGKIIKQVFKMQISGQIASKNEALEEAGKISSKNF